MQLQNDIRNGIFTDEMIRTINSRYKKGFSNLVSAPGLIPIVTISNVQIKKWYDANSMELSNKMISNGDEPPVLLLVDIQCKSCRRRGDVNVLKRKRNTRGKEPFEIIAWERIRLTIQKPSCCVRNELSFRMYMSTAEAVA